MRSEGTTQHDGGMGAGRFPQWHPHAAHLQRNRWFTLSVVLFCLAIMSCVPVAHGLIPEAGAEPVPKCVITSETSSGDKAGHETPCSECLTDSEYVYQFEKFISDYHKVYETPDEKEKRFQIFKERYDEIQKHNSGGHSFKMGINQFADLTAAEFSASYLGIRMLSPRALRSAFGTVTKRHLYEDAYSDDDLNDLPLATLYHYAAEFQHFIKQYEKIYASLEEKLTRFKIFIDNSIKISEHNEEKRSYTLAMNHFGDLTKEEFRQKQLGFYIQKPEPEEITSTVTSNTHPLKTYKASDLPVDVDWSKKGCVSEVKNQRQCGSCWAFSATGAVEGAYCAKYGKLPDLSEQQLVDCAQHEGNHGCKGGGMDQAFTYMIKEKGLCSEMAYPYKAAPGKCLASHCTAQVNVVKYVDIPHYDTEALMAAVYSHGPVSVGVQSDDWQFYKSGVYDAPCGKRLNHGVLLIGYGVEDEIPYWLIKNSWGLEWGDHGFMKLTRHVTKRYGECGILIEPSYPVVA